MAEIKQAQTLCSKLTSGVDSRSAQSAAVKLAQLLKAKRAFCDIWCRAVSPSIWCRRRDQASNKHILVELTEPSNA